MSRIADWSYKSTATVFPLIDRDDDGVEQYGAGYTVKCEYAGESKTRRDNTGSEFVSRSRFTMGASGVKQGDLISRGDNTAGDPIGDVVRMVNTVDNSMLSDTDDYVVIV